MVSLLIEYSLDAAKILNLVALIMVSYYALLDCTGQLLDSNRVSGDFIEKAGKSVALRAMLRG
jgi:hypothetical protein